MLKGLSTILKGLFTLEIQDLSTIFEELKEFSDVLDDYHKDFIRLPQSFLIISFFEKVETGNMGLMRHDLSFFHCNYLSGVQNRHWTLASTHA